MYHHFGAMVQHQTCKTNATVVATGEALPNKTAWRREDVLVPGWKGLFPGERSGTINRGLNNELQPAYSKCSMQTCVTTQYSP